MINGQLTLYPYYEMGEKLSYQEIKNLQTYKHLPCRTNEGVEVYITISEELFDKYSEQIMTNKWGNSFKFRVWGEIRSLNEATSRIGLSNLYIRVNNMVLEESDKEINLFWLNAHGTKTVTTEIDSNYFWIAANKSILTKKEKRNKPSYSFLKTSKSKAYKNKDVIQGNVKLAYNENKKLYLEELYTIGMSDCRKLVENFLPEYSQAI